MKKFIGVKIVKAEPMKQRACCHVISRTFTGDGEADGYLVEYDTGYRSWCPKAQFEEANRPCDAMTFGHAIEAMKLGKKVVRAGWNGYLKTMESAEGSGKKVMYVEETVSIGVISNADMLAEDWQIVN